MSDRKPRVRFRFSRPGRRGLLPRPRFIARLEAWVGEKLDVNPVVFSGIKLLVVTPLIIAALTQVLPRVGHENRLLVMLLFVAFVVLDAIERAVARKRGLEPHSARVFDRFTDYPLLVAVAYLATAVLPAPLLLAKVSLDFLLLGLFALGRGRTENRMRTGISYASLIALLIVGQGWGGRFITPQVVEYLLWANIAFCATTAAYYLGFLQKRFVADALSAANLLCGVFAIVFASRGRFEISLLFVILGTAFDGFDGAAARRWGGTRWGVYSDDVADGVNYGIAPGFALYYALGGIEGLALGIFYAVFTVSRLVFFTLNKADSDPNYFAGVPSPVGGLVAMASIVVFRSQPALVGLMIGIACAQMVSFSTHYRHLGRAITKHRRALVGAPVYLLVLLIGLRLWGPQGAAGLILVGNLVYGFAPTVLAFNRVLSARRPARRQPPRANSDPQRPLDDEDEEDAGEPALAVPRGA